MIPFNIPPQVGTELDYMRQAMANNKICGDGPFTRRCDEWMEQRFHAGKVLLTTSGTTALEMAALLCGAGYAKIWPLFGACNQLVSVPALMAAAVAAILYIKRRQNRE